MKRIVEIENAGLESLLGEKVTLLCANYFYTGKLVGVNDFCVELESPEIIYETGPWQDAEYEDAQALPCKTLNVCIGFIESFGLLK